MLARPRRGSLWLAVAALAAVLAALLALRGGGAPPPPTVLVARGPLPSGTLVDEEGIRAQIARAPVPHGLRLEGLITRASEVLGRRTVAPLLAGEPITQAVLGGSPGTEPAPLVAGERAVPVPAASLGAAVGGLVVGARVDAVASSGEGPAGRTRVIVRAAEVLAVDAPLDVPEAASVLLRVSSADALRLTAALNFARDVRLLVRPFGEDEAAPTGEAGLP